MSTANPSIQTRLVRALAGLVVTAALLWGMASLLGPGAYDWIKALHVVSIIAWMAGMLYLPRLFVYHCAVEKDSPQSETFKVMERRLLRVIINPAMVAAWVAGLWLMWQGGWFSTHWFHVKLLLVVAMSGVHGMFTRWVADFAAGTNRHSQKFYRVINEVPTVLMIFIVILVVVKPF